MNKPRFSIIILCYRHFEYLPSAIDSVLAQDYPNIELIISDDGSPNFPKEELDDYISARKGPNVTNVILHQEEANCGTVRHLNHAVPLCTGDYIVLLAGDDVLYDAHVLTSYAGGFSHAPEDCWIEMAQTAMYDENLEVWQGFYLKPQVQAALEKTETDASDLRRLLVSQGACLPSTSTCFKKGFFERFHGFNEDYALVEDYPMHVRLAEEGWIIHYENFVAIKHRSGGISHGQKDTLSHSTVLYFNDSQRMIEDLLLKNADLLDREERKKVIRQRKRELHWIQYQMARSDRNYLQMLLLALKQPGDVFAILLGRLNGWASRYHKALLAVFLSLWIFSPVIAGMFETATALSAYGAAAVLLVLARLAFALWLLCILVMGLEKLYLAIRRFPGESLRVG